MFGFIFTKRNVQAAEEAKVGAVQKSFSWRELAVLLSGYEYAAIVLVDSRFLYPAAYTAATETAAAAAAASATTAAVGQEAMPTVRPKTLPASLPKAYSEPSLSENALVSSSSGRGPDAAVTCRREGRGGLVARESTRTGYRSGRGQAVLDTRGGDWRRDRRRDRQSQVSQRDGRPSYPMRGLSDEMLAAGTDGSSSPMVATAISGGRKRIRTGLECMSPESLDETGWDSSSSSSSGLGDFATHVRSPLSPLPSGSNLTTGTHILPCSSQDLLSSPRPIKKKAVSCPSLCQSLSSPKLSEPKAALCASVSTATGFSSALTANPPPDTASPSSSPSSYCGHYILLVGWSEADGVFIARDPSLPSSPPTTVSPGAISAAVTRGGDSAAGANAHIGICLTPEALDRARQSHGTDEDVLVIDLVRSRKGGVAAGQLAAAAAATALAASAASSAAAASALVGLFAMAAAAAAGAEASGFREFWGWPDPVAWLAKHGGMDGAKRAERDGAQRGGVGGGGLPEGVPESAARRIASLLSLAANGLRFSTIGEAYNNRNNGSRDARDVGNDSREGGSESASNKLASMLSLAASQLRFPTVTTAGDGDNRTATAMSREARARAESAAKKLASLLSIAASGFRFYAVSDGQRFPREGSNRGTGDAGGDANSDGERERWADRVAHALEGLLEGGRWGSRRAAETMEGFFEGGRRAAYSLRDSLADVADAPGGAGAECGWGVACACCGDVGGNTDCGDAPAVVSSA